jgi:hypothetical protein
LSPNYSLGKSGHDLAMAIEQLPFRNEEEQGVVPRAMAGGVIDPLMDTDDDSGLEPGGQLGPAIPETFYRLANLT